MDKITRQYICSVLDCLQDIAKVSFSEYVDSFQSVIDIGNAQLKNGFGFNSIDIQHLFLDELNPDIFYNDFYAKIQESEAGKELRL